MDIRTIAPKSLVGVNEDDYVPYNLLLCSDNVHIVDV